MKRVVCEVIPADFGGDEIAETSTEVSVEKPLNQIVSDGNIVLKELEAEGTLKEKFLDLSPTEQARFILKFNLGINDNEAVDLPDLKDMKIPDKEVLRRNCIWPYKKETFIELSRILAEEELSTVSRSLIFIEESIEPRSQDPILRTHEITVFAKTRSNEHSLTQRKNGNVTTLSYRVNRMIYRSVPQIKEGRKDASWVNTGSIYLNHSGILPNSSADKAAIKRMKAEFYTPFHRGTYILEPRPNHVALDGLYSTMNWFGSVIKTNVKLLKLSQLDEAIDDLLR